MNKNTGKSMSQEIERKLMVNESDFIVNQCNQCVNM